MTDETIEQFFRRFQVERDPAAMAAVFDRVAPRLLLLAAHVTPDPAAAEDLLQETFLQAIARAEQWDPSRPLLPWLGGVLRHRAQDLARRSALRRPAARLDEVVASATGPGPRQAAETAELLDRVEQALAGLESPYREALVLRVVHGLEPAAIAHALGRPPATVRTQLRRGLERLRGALPVALAGALALLLSPGRGLAATRRAVLDGLGAGGAAPTGGGRRAAGLPARPGWLVIGGVLVVAVAIAFLIVPVLFFDPVAPSPSPTPAPTGANLARSDASAPLADRRVEVATTGEPANGDAPTTLRGRLVASDGRTPLAGGTAVVSFGRGRFMTEDPEFRRWPDPIEVRTDGRGVFAVEFVPTRERRVFLEVAAPGHVSASTEWTSLRSGADFDLGDIPLVRGCALGGRVVDQDGRPVVGVTLDIELRAGRFDDGNPLFSGWHSFESTSESDGTLSVQDVPAPGTYAISVASYRTPGWQVLQPQQVEIADERALAPEIVVGRPASEASLGGFLVDERDRPVAGVSVSLAAEFAEWGSAPSGDNGAFWLPWELPHAEHELHLLLGERRYRLLEPAREYARGARDVVVRLVRQPTFDVPIEVVDAQSGVPVESFGLAHVIDYWTEAMQLKIPPDRIYRPVAAAPQPGGRALLRDLPPGDYRLCVWPGVPTFATAYLVPFTVGERGAMPVRVELAGYAPLSVDVRDEAGEPVAGVEVGLIHMMATGGNYSGLFSVEQFARGIGGGRSTAVLLQTVATDATGKVTLRAPIGEPRLGLRVTGPTIGRATHSVDAVPAAGAEFTVTVEARAQVVGRIGPRALLDLIGPDAEARRLAAMVREEDSDLANACPVLWLENAEGSGGGRGVLLPDGSFRIDSAKPGDWQLRLRVDWRMDSGFYSSETLQVGDLAALRAGEVRQVAFEIADFAPARLHGNVTVGGVPAPRGQLGLLARGLDRRLYFHVGIAAGGHYALVLRPGSYLPYVTWREEGGDRYLFADSRCELPPGSDLAVDFAFEHRRLEVNVQHADGTPAAGVRLRWQAVDFPGVNERTGSQCEADDAGVVTFDPAPPGRVQLFVPGDGGALVGEVAAGVGPSSAARVRLPE